MEISDVPGNMVLWGGYCWIPHVERIAYMQTYHEDVCCVNIPGETDGMGRGAKEKEK